MSNPFSLTEVQTAYMLGRNSQFELSGISPQTYFEYETALDINRLSKKFSKGDPSSSNVASCNFTRGKTANITKRS